MSADYVVPDEQLEDFIADSIGGEIVEREGVPKRAKGPKKPQKKEPAPMEADGDEDGDEGAPEGSYDSAPQGGFGDPIPSPSIDLSELRQGHAQIMKRLTETQAMIRDVEVALDGGAPVKVDGIDLSYLKPEKMRLVFDALDRKIAAVQKAGKSYQDGLAGALRKAAVAGSVAGAVVGGAVAAIILGIQFIIK